MKNINKMVCGVKAIAVITVVLTLLRPTTAGFGDLLSSIVNTCQYSACASQPMCSTGYDVLTTTREGCSGFKEKHYCCPAGSGPQCFNSDCGRETSCPGNYRELDRTRNGCSGFNTKVYCCKTTNLPFCFDLSCPAFSESKKFCPPDYKKTKRVSARSAGCDSAFAERVTCCFRDNNQNSNTNNNTEIITETKTVTLEDGSVRTVTRTQTHSKSTSGWFSNLFSNSLTCFSSFFKILLLLPILAAIL